MRLLVCSTDALLLNFINSLDKSIYNIHHCDSSKDAELMIAAGTDVLIADEQVSLNDIEILKAADLHKLIYISDITDPVSIQQLYAVGVDEWIPRPAIQPVLFHRLENIRQHRETINKLSSDYQFAHNTAMDAMSGNSELGQIIKFVEQSYFASDTETLAQSFFNTTNAFGLKCVLMFTPTDEQHLFFSSRDEIKPLEQQLLIAAKNEQRLHNMGVRTIVNFPYVSVLIKNMPIDDQNRYGRIKDALPVLLGSLNAKIGALNAEQMVHSQTEDLGYAFDVVRHSFMHLNSVMSERIQSGNKNLSNMLNDLSMNLPRMGLDDDQEDYILNKVENARDDSEELLHAEREMVRIFHSIQDNLQQVVAKQNDMLELLRTEENNLPVHNNDFAAAEIELF
ncbi:MAG: hypothetical protein HUJ30_06840 [Gammaproteobacteria bacterium]|nr:hypothetical protein [Gammaproteobacteria bacterium]